MNRPVILVLALLMTAATVSATIVLVVRSNRPEHSRMTEEQRLARQKFFGFGNELPPIDKGQEMRPRW